MPILFWEATDGLEALTVANVLEGHDATVVAVTTVPWTNGRGGMPYEDPRHRVWARVGTQGQKDAIDADLQAKRGKGGR